MTLRGLFSFRVDPSKAISIDKVEPVEKIVKGFPWGYVIGFYFFELIQLLLSP